MDVEKELRKINFAELSRVREELLRKILAARQLQREKGTEDLDKVSAAGKITDD